jgi:hypothetical protein
LANPLYVVQSSTGPGPWKGVNTAINPQQLSWTWIFTSTSAGSTASGDFKIEYTVDNPFVYGDATRGQQGGLVNNPSSAAPLVFTLTPISSAATGLIALSTTFITAWRLNQQSSGFTVTATFLQTGVVM